MGGDGRDVVSYLVVVVVVVGGVGCEAAYLMHIHHPRLVGLVIVGVCVCLFFMCEVAWSSC